MSDAQDRILRLPKEILRPDADTTQAKLWALFADQVDELEAVNEQVRILYSIADNEGANLDQLGDLVGETRQGKNDADYREALALAVQRIASKGDIYSINEIAKALGFTDINIEERFGYENRLDGTWLLDGSRLLDGQYSPATFYFFRDKNVDDVTGDFYIGEAIESVRAAGVKAVIGFIFTSNESQCVVYTTYTGVLDGTWPLDGEKMLNPDKTDYTPNYLALGDGAQPGGTGPVRTPLPGDTGLQNELIRKPVSSLTIDGVRVHSIRLDPSDLSGNYINEMGIFLDSSPVLIDSFISKSKDAVTIMDFKIKEND